MSDNESVLVNVLTKRINVLNYTTLDENEYNEAYFKHIGLTNVDIRSYQLHGIRWLIERYEKGHGAILSDEMGLGKTLQTIGFLLYVCKAKKQFPSIVISPLSVLQNWTKELSRFAPGLNIQIFTGAKDERNELAETIKKSKFDILLTTYEYILKDTTFFQSFNWKVLIIDEAHRIKNSQSLLHGALKTLNVSCRILLTGTPIQNNLSELYSLLSFCAPNVFYSTHHEDFVQYFQNINKDETRKKILISFLKPFVLRRLKRDVLTDLPDKTELMIYHDLSKIQKELYKAILTKNRSIFGPTEAGSKTSLVNIMMQLRKAIGHPYLFPGVEPEPFEMGEHLIEASGKLHILDHLLAHLYAKKHKVLLFSQFTMVLDVLQDYLTYREIYKYERLDGSVRSEERFLAINNFNTKDDTFIFLLSTKAGGVGLNLVAADTVIFYDSDFNPQNDLQAADRCHRIGQKRPVRIIRLVCQNSFEEVILRRAEVKLKLSKTIMENGELASGLNTVIETKTQLQDVLRIGIDKLLDETAQMDYTKIDFNDILGETDKNGHWLALAENKENEDKELLPSGSTNDDSMYVFEGVDYRDAAKKPDIDLFDRLITTDEKASSTTGSLSNHRTIERTQRHQMTEEEKVARAAKIRETKARQQQEMEEAERRREERRKAKREQLWTSNNYCSCRVLLSEDEDEETDETALSDSDDDSSGETKLHYVFGDVMKPQLHGEKCAISVHCVDDSGRWPAKGVFASISKRSKEPEKQYTLAAEMDDINMGDAHVISLNDCVIDDEPECDQYVALIVAQHRYKFDFTALDSALRGLAKRAKELKASVHLPRIGVGSQGFNWYGTEKLIKKYLSSCRIPTYIYYFKRDGSATNNKRSNEESLGNNKRMTTEKKTNHKDRLKIHLPSYLSGIHIFFHEIDDNTKRRLQRFIYAFDGDVDEKADSNTTTHILTSGECRDVLALKDACSNALIVNVEWLDVCVSQGRKLHTDIYEL
ncbi:unnamed protein product [Rotaria socialis]|uniref:Chromodomain-helicase-DNA-binding protein 1-like protein n=1 Tax=Rotaria socialis TaxID=392032 RepID=A0A818S1F9_9BILA|nr:unnamed protein product [Rotaria socialis]CAF4305950.1 unnamed protein product [Rotaria socialis]